MRKRDLDDMCMRALYWYYDILKQFKSITSETAHMLQQHLPVCVHCLCYPASCAGGAAGGDFPAWSNLRHTHVSSSNQCESYMWNLMCKYTCFLPDCFKDSKWTQGCELVQAGYSSCTVLIVYSNTSETKKCSLIHKGSPHWAARYVWFDRFF